MAFDLPIYMIVGNQPISFERTADGGAVLKGWDFERRAMRIGAASLDDIEALQPGLPVRDSFALAEGDTQRVTKAEFDAAVARLRR